MCSCICVPFTLALTSHLSFTFTFKLNFLSAKKTPRVKWHNIIKEVIDADTPNPLEPYANMQIGNPIFPVLGKIKGGSSLTISLVFNVYKVKMPTKANKPIAKR